MISIFRKIFLKLRPIEVGDEFYGYTKDLSKDEAVRNLNRLMSVSVLDSKNGMLKVTYKYYGAGGKLVMGSKLIKRSHMNEHYASGRINYV